MLCPRNPSSKTLNVGWSWGPLKHPLICHYEIPEISLNGIILKDADLVPNLLGFSRVGTHLSA